MRVMHVYQEQGSGLQLTECFSLLVESAVPVEIAAALIFLLLVVDLDLVAQSRSKFRFFDTCAVVSRPCNPSAKVRINCCNSKRRQGERAEKLRLAKTGR